MDDIILLAKLLVGRMRGSLAQINIVASVFFATMSGSAVADTAAIGGMLLPAMEKEGYDKEFSVAVTAASSIIGPIIPPSITMIVYGSLMSNVPTGAMFAAGIVPGVLIGLAKWRWFIISAESAIIREKPSDIRQKRRPLLQYVPFLRFSHRLSL